MTKIIDYGDYAEVVNKDGIRLFCSLTVEGAQKRWEDDTRKFGMFHLGFEPLPVEQAPSN